MTSPTRSDWQRGAESADAVVAALVERGVPALMLEAVVEKGRKTVHVERVP